MVNWIIKNRTVWSSNWVYLQNVFTNHIFNIYVKQNLALNYQQWLICHKQKPKQSILLIRLYTVKWFQVLLCISDS